VKSGPAAQPPTVNAHAAINAFAAPARERRKEFNFRQARDMITQ
jgi:hypothetical protein